MNSPSSRAKKESADICELLKVDWKQQAAWSFDVTHEVEQTRDGLFFKTLEVLRYNRDLAGVDCYRAPVNSSK